MVKIAYLGQEYQKLISSINTIRMVKADVASVYFLLELHVRLMSFLFASYNDSQKPTNRPEIRLARDIRNMYTHSIHNKVINFDFRPVNNKYCEPYIALNSDIDEYDYRGSISASNITISPDFIVPNAVKNSYYNDVTCINLFVFINDIYKIISNFYK